MLGKVNNKVMEVGKKCKDEESVKSKPEKRALLTVKRVKGSRSKVKTETCVLSKISERNTSNGKD